MLINRCTQSNNCGFGWWRKCVRWVNVPRRVETLLFVRKYREETQKPYNAFLVFHNDRLWTDNPLTVQLWLIHVFCAHSHTQTDRNTQMEMIIRLCLCSLPTFIRKSLLFAPFHCSAPPVYSHFPFTLSYFHFIPLLPHCWTCIVLSRGVCHLLSVDGALSSHDLIWCSEDKQDFIHWAAYKV